MIFEVAHHMALLPILWLIVLATLGRWPGREWGWLAGAFAVSWLADTAAHSVNPWIPAQVYLVSQAAIVGAVLLNRREAVIFTVVLGLAGIVGVLVEGVGPSLLLDTVAAGGIVGIVWSLPLRRLRLALLMAFGVGWVAWVGYVIAPGWTSWGLYQAVRLESLLLFCWAAWKPVPQLRVV